MICVVIGYQLIANEIKCGLVLKRACVGEGGFV